MTTSGLKKNTSNNTTSLPLTPKSESISKPPLLLKKSNEGTRTSSDEIKNSRTFAERSKTFDSDRHLYPKLTNNPLANLDENPWRI